MPGRSTGNGAKRSDVRRPPRRRRAGCFVGVCGFIAGGDKIGGNRTAVESFVVALGAALRVEKGKARADAGRAWAAEGIVVANFSLPKSEGTPFRVSRKMATRLLAIIAHPAKNVRLAQRCLPVVPHRLISVRWIGIAGGQFGYREMSRL